MHCRDACSKAPLNSSAKVTHGRCCEQVHRNLDPALRPHEKEVEYTRALNAAKLQRVFAKPFLGSLPHDEGVTCLARNPAQLNSLVSGAADGVVRLWDIAGQRCLRRLEGNAEARSILLILN
jgi:WD repeat and SOF domain-containing protein 1